MASKLSRLVREIRACKACAAVLPVAPRPVLQVSRDARILIAGQAPGRAVFESGIPFDDPSGERLRGWLGTTRDEFYDASRFAIVPMGFCYPGKGASGDLPPRKECAPLWRSQLIEALPRIELVVSIGAYAAAYHVGPGQRLTDVVRAWRAFAPELVPVPHPSPRNQHWFQKNPWFDAEVVPALQRRVRAVLDTKPRTV